MRSTVRLEIQALRAAAVLIVVLYHLWPHLVPGGFVGVDVFFVISGFLITGHLLKEIDRTGRIELSQFWARRARRLLPASLLTLAATIVGIVVFVPEAHWQQFFKEVGSSALYVQNWMLAADSVDYLAAENTASPAQHFWSLSAEEQFYAVWPLLMLAALWVGRRFGPRGRRVTVLVALSVAATASFVYSVHLTATSPGPAYFVTPTRAWEFAAGGIVAALGTLGGVKSQQLRTGMAWVGWLSIAATAFAYSSATPFPSYTALLPVLGAVAVIWAGAPGTQWSPNLLLTSRPIIFIGDISYSVYLWHWPLIVFFSFSLGEDFSWWIKLAVAALTIVLAWLTTTFVENPVREGNVLTRFKPRWTLATALLATALVVAPALGGWSMMLQKAGQETARAAELLANDTPCFGAAALDPTADCRSVEFDTLTPNPAVALEDKPVMYADGCIATSKDARLLSCAVGDSNGLRVGLIGDSHAVSWHPSLQALADENGWELTTFVKTACPHSSAPHVKTGQTDVKIYESCREWNESLTKHLAEVEPFDLVFVANSAANDYFENSEVAVAGYREAWKSYTDRGDGVVVVIRDVPRMTVETRACLENNREPATSCGQSIGDALASEDQMVAAAKGQDRAAVVDMTDYFCTDGYCPAAIGGVVTHRDAHHLTATFSKTLAPYLLNELEHIEWPTERVARAMRPAG